MRQLEALFNLSQLLFGLSRAETVNYTFRDLQLRKYPHSFKKSGFKQLNIDGRIDFYAIFEQLVQNIIEEGGLEVTLLIYKVFLSKFYLKSLCQSFIHLNQFLESCFAYGTPKMLRFNIKCSYSTKCSM